VSRDGACPRIHRRPCRHTAAAGERINVAHPLVARRDDPMAVNLKVSTVPNNPALPRGTWVVWRDSLRAGRMSPPATEPCGSHTDPGSESVQIRLGPCGARRGSRPSLGGAQAPDHNEAHDTTGERGPAEAPKP